MGLILTIDTGSSSMRGTLFNETGWEIARSTRPYRMRQEDGQTVEMEAAVFAGALADILGELTARAKAAQATIDAVCLTSQRSSVLALDSAGTPLRPILMWHDKRSIPICEEINRDAAGIYAICGMKASPVFSAPKMRWLKDNERQTYDRAAKLAGIHDYLLFLLTGRMITDSSLASRTNLLNLATGAWSGELLERFAIDRAKLCDIVNVGSICASVHQGAAARYGLMAGTPVVSAGGDQQCAALGLGVIKHGDTSINTGSAAFVTVAMDHPVLDPEMRVLCNAASIAGQWVVEGGTLSAGLAYHWCAEEFRGRAAGLFEDANACSEASPPGANGIIMVPSLGGKGAPYWNPDARGFFHNVGFTATRGDFIRATLEGIAAELADCLETVREVAGLPAFSTVNCAGGLSRSRLFNEVLADTADTGLRCFINEESGSRGAWMVAAVALGLFADHAAAFASATREETFLPYSPNPARHALYARINKARRYIYEAVDMRALREMLAAPDAPAGGR